ncbi:MAG: FecR domain-containing protein [Polyangiales bacterium]
MSHPDDSPLCVDELPDAEWARIEEVVFAELDGDPSLPSSSPNKRPRNSVALIAVAALSVAASVLLMVGLDAFAVRDDAAAPTTQSTRFRGGPEGAELALDDVRLVLGPNAQGLAVGSSDSGWVVALDEGRVEFVVAPRDERPRFVVQAANTRVEVVGTRFVVTRDSEHVDVEVREGVVRVTHANEASELRAGQQWSTNEEPVIPEAGPEEAEGSDLDPSARPRPSRRTDAQRYERAAALEAQDAASAIRIYRRLARGGGPWAEAALFARGRLELESGSPESGARVLRLYLQRYPRGVNAEDARFLLSQGH